MHINPDHELILHLVQVVLQDALQVGKLPVGKPHLYQRMLGLLFDISTCNGRITEENRTRVGPAMVVERFGEVVFVKTA
ncbi:hypothetical protein D3C71_1662350 [compost metagenome]